MRDGGEGLEVLDGEHGVCKGLGEDELGSVVNKKFGCSRSFGSHYRDSIHHGHYKRGA